MRVALDTNVLISAYTARGLSADVYRLILTEHDLVVPQVVLDEFTRILQDKFRIPSTLVAEFVEELCLHDVVARVSLHSALDAIRDPDDRHVVAAAIHALSDCLITGDKDILDARDHLPQLTIQTPREFWESIR